MLEVHNKKCAFATSTTTLPIQFKNSEEVHRAVAWEVFHAASLDCRTEYVLWGLVTILKIFLKV